jgi:hypothetical protein
MARIQKRRLYLTLVAILLSSVLAWGFGCGGGGGGGDGGGAATQEFQAVAFFPLTSSWETDNWTLFIDERQHDVNGTMTKAMVDTSEPTVFYWTCDDDGLRLHRFIDDDEGPLDLSPPILIAAAVAKVGDRWEDTYTVKTEAGIDLGQIKVTSEIVGIEDVSVPAGNFADCFKIEVAELDIDDDSLLWKETWWLAEGVGLVKIVYSPESVDEDGFFAGEGDNDNIKLLGYHITSSDLTEDEKKIKKLRGDFSDAWEQEDEAAIANLHSDSWSSRCKDKTARMQEYADSFAANENIANFASISDIVINGNEARCMIQRLSVGIDDGTGDEWASWNRSSSHMIKEGDEWKFYGSHQDFSNDWYRVFKRQYPDESKFLVSGGAFSDCSGNRIQVDSFTLTGPPGTYIDRDLTQEWVAADSEYFFKDIDLTNAATGFYTCTVEKDGNIHQRTDYLEVWPFLDIPDLVDPIDGATNTPVDAFLDWNPVAGAHAYVIELVELDAGDNWVSQQWQTTPSNQTQCTFFGLKSGTTYQWRVRPRNFDDYGDWDNETRSGFRKFTTLP